MNATYFFDVAFQIDRAIRDHDRAAYARILAKVRADGHHKLADHIEHTQLQAADQEKC